MGVPSSQAGGRQPFYRKTASKSSGANSSPQYDGREILPKETIIVRVGVNCFCDDIEIYIPGWVEDVSSFLRWSKSGGIPEGARAWWLEGDVWVEMGGESVLTHRAVKDVFHAVLGEFIRAGGWGRYYADKVLLSNGVVGFAGRPDGVFVQVGDKAQEQVCIIKGGAPELVMMEGAATIVLEVVSDSWPEKDTKILRRAYYQAGIYEYWLVDARNEPLVFEILRYTPKGYRASPKKDGWIKSNIFGKSFRLIQETNEAGEPEYTLDVR
jgi:Putative restriction endonuclease